MAITWIIGGAGTGIASDAATYATVQGGGYDPDIVGWADAQGVNGEVLADNANAAITQNGANITVTSDTPGDFTNAIVGVVARVIGVGYDDYGLITRATADDMDVTIAHNGDEANGVAAIVGGALRFSAAAVVDAGFLEDIFELPVAGDIVKMPNTQTLGVAAAVAANGAAATNSGTEANRITVVGVDSNGVELTSGQTKPIIQPITNDIAGGLIEISGNVDYWDWKHLNFNGNDGEAIPNIADYGIYCNDTSSAYHRFINVDAHHTSNTGIKLTSTSLFFHNCDLYSNGIGLDCNAANSEAIGCKFRDNSSHGITWNSTEGTLSHCEAYGNTGIGFNCSSNTRRGNVSNNVAYSNGGNGFEFNVSSAEMRCYNNISVNNTGDGYDLNTDIGHFVYFGNNNSFNNTSGHSDIESGDAGWAALGQGSWEGGANTFADPMFYDPPENFTIMNDEVFASGIPGPDGRPTTVGSGTPVFTGVLSKRRSRYAPPTHGYKAN